MNKVVKNGLIGLGIGMTWYGIISMFYVDEEIRKGIISCIVMSVVIGIASGLFSDSNIEKYGLLKVTISHFFICIVSYFACAFYSQWLPPYMSSYVISGLLFLLIYFVIWCAIYIHTYRSIKKINKQLKKNG